MEPESKPWNAPKEVEEGLTIRGDLQESSIPELLRSLIQNRETGILTVTRDESEKSVYLKEGRVVFASSADPDDRLGEVLLRTGRLTLEQYLESSKHIRPEKRQGTVLIELGYISPDDLVHGIREQVEEILYSLFQWTRGEYKVLLKELDTLDLITLNLSTENLIFEGIRRIRAWSRILRGIGASVETVFGKTEDAEGIVYKLDMTEDESHVFSVVNGKITVAQICAMSYLPNFETCRTLWGFVSLGAIVPVGARDAQTVLAEEVEELDEEAVLDTVARFGRALDLLRGEVAASLGEGAVEPFLQSALRQIRGHYPDIFEGVELAGGILETDVVLRNLRAHPGAARGERGHEALNDLVYAALLHLKMKLGIEVERRVSDEVARILSEV